VSQDLHGRMGLGSSDRNKSELTGAIAMPGNLVGAHDFSHNLSGVDSKQGSDAQMATLQNARAESSLHKGREQYIQAVALDDKQINPFSLEK
jgi:hypothetical protein